MGPTTILYQFFTFRANFVRLLVAHLKGNKAVEKAVRWIWLCAIIYIGILDIVSTYLILQQGGMELSTSPAFLMETFGRNIILFVIMPIWKGAIILAIWLVLTKLLTKKWLPGLNPSAFTALKSVVYLLIYGYLAIQVFAVISNFCKLSAP